MNYTLDFDITLGFRRPKFEKFYHTLWIILMIFLLALGPLILYSDVFVNTRTNVFFDSVTISGQLSSESVIFPLFSQYKANRFSNVTKSETKKMFGLDNYLTDLMSIYKLEFNSSVVNIPENAFSTLSYKYIDDYLFENNGPLSFDLTITAIINNSYLTINAKFPFDNESRNELLNIVDRFKMFYSYDPKAVDIQFNKRLKNLIQIEDFKTISFIDASKNSENNITLRHITKSYQQVYWDVSNTLNTESENTFEIYFIVISSDKSSITFVKNITLIAFYSSTILIILQSIYNLLNPNPVQTWLSWIPLGRKILEIIDAIQIARENFNYYLERMLYLKLINIFRSPELVKAITMETHQYIIEQDKHELTKQMARLKKKKSKMKDKKNIKNSNRI